MSLRTPYALLPLALLGAAAAAAPPAAPAPRAAALDGDLAWRLIGPFRGGRTRAVAGVPGEPHVFYIGAVDGGVWKTDDAGRTWHPIFEQQPTQSIGAIAVAPSDPNIVYVGSGEGLRRPDLSVGDGIYRSTTRADLDAPRPARRAADRRARRRSRAIPTACSPRCSAIPTDRMPSAASTARWTAATSWQRVLYKDADTGGSAVAIDPADPHIVYAGLWQARLGPWEDKNEYDGTGGGLYKSIDGGEHLEAAHATACRRT